MPELYDGFEKAKQTTVVINASALYHCRFCVVTREASVDVASVGLKDSPNKTNDDVLKFIVS